MLLHFTLKIHHRMGDFQGTQWRHQQLELKASARAAAKPTRHTMPYPLMLDSIATIEAPNQKVKAGNQKEGDESDEGAGDHLN